MLGRVNHGSFFFIFHVRLICVYVCDSCPVSTALLLRFKKKMFSVGLKRITALWSYLVFVEFAQILPLHHLSFHLPPGHVDDDDKFTLCRTHISKESECIFAQVRALIKIQ